MIEPTWVYEGRRWIGLKEIPGAASNSTILHWLTTLSAWWRDDETPWCGTFVAHCLAESGFDIPKYWMRAKVWSDYGRPLTAPQLGCLVVFSREGGGHVGFVVGQDERGNLLVLGGNQGNRVSIAAFPWSRVVAFRWPDWAPIYRIDPLPVLASAELSPGEA